MRRWFPLTESDDEFIRAAPIRFAHTVDVPAPPETIWALLTADDALTSWADGITGSEWTSPRPFGVGTTRTVTVGHGAAALRERFYRWDVNERMTFTVDEANRPGFRRFAEDMTLRPSATGTSVTWTFAAEGAAWFAPLLAASRPVANKVTAGWARGIVTRARQHQKHR